MRWRDLLHDTSNGRADQAAKAEKIAKATKRKQDANTRYQAKVRSAQDAAKLAALSPDPAKANERRTAANLRIADARGVLQRTTSAANDSINSALKPDRA